MCGFASDDAINALRNKFPPLRGALQYVRIGAHKSSPARIIQTQPYLTTEGVSLGHSVLGINYHEGNTGMILSIDPTIASIDLTNDYDIEIARVRRGDYPHFLRLRYRTFRDSKIGMRG